MKFDRNACFVSLASYGYFNSDAPTRGGAERQLYLLSQELREEFSIHFVVGDYGQDRVEQRNGTILHRAYTPKPNATGCERVVQLVKLLRAMRQSDADVFVVRSAPRKALIVGMLATILRKPWVYNIAADSFVERPPSGLPERMVPIYERALRGADQIIAQSETQQRDLRKNYDAESIVVPNGYPTANDLLPYTQREAFFWAGRLNKQQKRPHLYLDLAEVVPKSNFRLAALPDDDPVYQRLIEERADSLKNVEYLGAVPPEEIHQYYRKAIAVVNTSTVEGFPNTFLEAWRYDTPVVSLDIDPGRYTNIDDYAGFADKSFDELVELVSSLASSPKRRSRLSKRTHQYFRQNLQIDSVADEYADVLRDVK